MIDQEGGRVDRLNKIFNFETLTSEFFGNLYLEDKKKFKFYYKIFIEKTAALLRDIGVNINNVPVLDLRRKGFSNVIGDRSFSKNHIIVSKIGDYCIDLFKKNNRSNQSQKVKKVTGNYITIIKTQLLTISS